LKNQRKKMLRGQNKKEVTHPGFYFMSKLWGRCTSDPPQEDREQSQFFF
jgi:hypothetical protein